MGFLRTLRRHHQLLNLNNSPQFLRNPRNTTSSIFSISHESYSIPSLFGTYASLSAQSECRIDTDSVNSTDSTPKPKKPLNLLFKEAVGLSENHDHRENEAEIGNGNVELNSKLQKLQIELKNLKENKRRNSNDDSGKPRLLSQMFTKKNAAADDSKKPTRLYNSFTEKKAHRKRETGDLGKESERVVEPLVYKELSSDMAVFANHLYKQGYFLNANFSPRKKFDVMCFENNYGRQFLKHAAEKFGNDNREIAKWLSGNDLKTVAQFGCPSLTKKNVFSAKRLRKFFKIQEDTVCSKCVLKPSCEFANQNIWKGNTNNLDLAVIMRIIILYGLDYVPSNLVVSDEVKASISRLIKEILRLSETVK